MQQVARTRARPVRGTRNPRRFPRSQASRRRGSAGRRWRGRGREGVGSRATFTRAATDPALHLQIVYRAEPLAIEVDGAESATAARIVSDQDVAEPAQSTYSATVDGVYFQIHTSQALDDQLLADMARAQVDKIRNR